MTHLKAFSQSIKTYVEGIGDVTAIDRESLRRKWESSNQDEDPVEDPLEALLGGLGAGLGTGLFATKPEPKVDSYGKLLGITPRLCTVRTICASTVIYKLTLF